jgi:hypothetical protein
LDIVGDGALLVGTAAYLDATVAARFGSHSVEAAQTSRTHPIEWRGNYPYCNGKALMHRKLTFDTGAAINAIPSNFAPGYRKSDANGASYATASGETIDDEGSQRIQGVDTHGNFQLIKGRCMDVHKLLIAAGQCCSGGQDAWLGHDGGYVYSKDSFIGREIRAYFELLIRDHGYEDLIPLYLEGGVYMMDWFLFPEDPDRLSTTQDESVSASSASMPHAHETAAASLPIGRQTQREELTAKSQEEMRKKWLAFAAAIDAEPASASFWRQAQDP